LIILAILLASINTIKHSGVGGVVDSA
jgi:hypothetical protein